MWPPTEPQRDWRSEASVRRMLERFEIVDAARKVVGVGSVGTRAFIVLLQGRDAQDPLFLQIKEATASVLEGYLPKSRYRQHGARVVHGQRMMQAASDIYLGWTKGLDVNRHFYWRQLRDMKGSALVELMTPLGLTFYARICGWTLARAHARSGDPVAIAAIPRRQRRVRPVDHRLLRALRRPERARLPGLRRRPSDPGGWKPSKASDDPVRMLADRRSARAVKTRGRSSNRGKSNEPTADLGLFEFLGRLTTSVTTVRTGSCASVEVVEVGDSVLL